MKNIILLITDTFRFDNLGARAARCVRTPELDAFAAQRATEIEGFYTGSFPTIPHRTDVATGRLGWPHYPWQPIHVPFLIAGGDIPHGMSLDMLAQPIDIQPTLSELAGVELAPPETFEGRSFAQALLDSRPDHRDLAVTGTFVRPADDGRLPSKCVTPWVTDGRWGFAPVGAAGTPELYDVVVDPFAENDVADAQVDVVRGLGARLASQLREHDAPDGLIESLNGAA